MPAIAACVPVSDHLVPWRQQFVANPFLAAQLIPKLALNVSPTREQAQDCAHWVSPMRLRIVIVDDEPLARERLRRLLESEPETEIVGECATGIEAVQAILQKSPDLVFLDVQMPELDGLGVLRSLHGRRSPAVIFVTAHDQ